MKKLLALVLALVMTLSLCTISNAAFTDAKDVDASYEEAVAVLNGMGVFKGYEDGSFKPEGSITRAEVAAIVYRLYTGDVKDKQAGLYAGYGKFDDMAGATWAAGYIGFCANAGFVKGYGDGKFGPSDPVTGYQALAMILRAVGYGKNGEFEGADWELHVAQIAQQLKVLKNVKGVSLKAAASRELVAELLFQVAAYVDTVEYTPAFGYVANTVVTAKAETLGEKNFNLTKSADGADNWGRPQYKWFSDDNGNKTVDTKETKYATIQAKPEATYTTAVTECQIAADVDLKDVKTYDLYTNGKVNVSKYKVQPTDTVQKLGAQGTLTEVYEDRIVVIDTFLAQVTDVKAAAYDAAGHLKTESRIDLKVYATDTAAVENGTAMYLTNGTTDYTYAKGDMVLVNAYTKNTVNPTTGAVTVTALDVTGTTPAYAEILGVAESMVGAQTFLWYNALQHTVEGENYNDAKWFKLDQAGTDVAKHTWFFDSYGNLIGVVDIATQYTYGIIENIQWQNPALAVGYAQATIRYMDGTTDTKVVASIDTKPLVYCDTGAAPAIGTTNVTVSTTWQLNAPLCGKDLYRIETNPNGTLALKHVFHVDATVEYNSHLTAADIKTGIAAIQGTAVAGDTHNVIYTNSNTVFLVQSPVAPYTYTVVKGYENMANYTVAANVTVDYVNLNGDSYADYVYVTGTPDSANYNGMFYLTSNNAQAVLGATGGIDHYLLTGIVDGVPGTIKLAGTATYWDSTVGTSTLVSSLTEAQLEAKLSSYVNQMFTVSHVNDKVVAMYGPKAGIANLYTETSNVAYTNLAMVKYVPGTGNTATWNGEVVALSSGLKFNVVGLTPVVGTFEANMSGKEIYVIYDTTNTIASAYVAKAVYIADPAESGTGSGSGVIASYAVGNTAGGSISAAVTSSNLVISNAKVVKNTVGSTGAVTTENFAFGTANVTVIVKDAVSGATLGTLSGSVTGSGTDSCVAAISVPFALASGNYKVTVTMSNATIGTLTVCTDALVGF